MDGIFWILVSRERVCFARHFCKHKRLLLYSVLFFWGGGSLGARLPIVCGSTGYDTNANANIGTGRPGFGG